MSEATKVLKAALPAIVVALLVGMTSSYLTAQATIAVFDQRITSLEHDMQDMEHKADDTSQRMIRVETKIDLLLEQR